jgi:hypothetical protein
MKHVLSPLTKDLIEAFLASAGLWLARLMGVLLAPRARAHKRRLARLVATAEAWVEQIILIMAARRLRVAPGKRRRINGSVVAIPGFRVSRGSPRLFLKCARIRLGRGSLTARVQRLIDVLADPQVYIARFAKRLARGLCLLRLVTSAPAASPFTSADALPVAIADSS